MNRWPMVSSSGAIAAARMVAFGLLPEQPLSWNATGWRHAYGHLKSSTLGCSDSLGSNCLQCMGFGPRPRLDLALQAISWHRLLFSGSWESVEFVSNLSLESGWPLLAVLHRLQEAYVREAWANPWPMRKQRPLHLHFCKYGESPSSEWRQTDGIHKEWVMPMYLGIKRVSKIDPKIDLTASLGVLDNDDCHDEIHRHHHPGLIGDHWAFLNVHISWGTLPRRGQICLCNSQPCRTSECLGLRSKRGWCCCSDAANCRLNCCNPHHSIFHVLFSISIPKGWRALAHEGVFPGLRCGAHGDSFGIHVGFWEESDEIGWSGALDQSCIVSGTSRKWWFETYVGRSHCSSGQRNLVAWPNTSLQALPHSDNPSQRDVDPSRPESCAFVDVGGAPDLCFAPSHWTNSLRCQPWWLHSHAGQGWAPSAGHRGSPNSGLTSERFRETQQFLGIPKRPFFSLFFLGPIGHPAICHHLLQGLEKVEVLEVAIGATDAGGALHCSTGHSAICHVLPSLAGTSWLSQRVQSWKGLRGIQS